MFVLIINKKATMKVKLLRATKEGINLVANQKTSFILDKTMK